MQNIYNLILNEFVNYLNNIFKTTAKFSISEYKLNNVSYVSICGVSEMDNSIFAKAIEEALSKIKVSTIVRISEKNINMTNFKVDWEHIQLKVGE